MRCVPVSLIVCSLFTFQYVSINTPGDLHFSNDEQKHLHSNMFLLILTAEQTTVWDPEFTFQYVSINTFVALILILRQPHLHSNMFLLIPVFLNIHWFCFHKFTFQYVSINTEWHFPCKSPFSQIYIPICFY